MRNRVCLVSIVCLLLGACTDGVTESAVLVAQAAVAPDGLRRVNRDNTREHLARFKRIVSHLFCKCISIRLQ